MPLYLTEKNVATLIDVGATIEALEQAFAALAKAAAVNHPRRRYKLLGGRLNIMLAADGPSRRFAVKAYGSNGVSCYHVLLYSADRGLLAIIEADQLGQIRTGAASGLATRHLARPEARRLGMIGAGRQARTQLLAVHQVRPLTSAAVFARNAESLGAFCEQMRRDTGLDVRPAASARAAIEGADIVVTATKSSTPVVEAAWLTPGMHVNAVGANAASRQELDPEAYAHPATLIAVDDIEQARVEAGELVALAAQSRLDWTRVHTLGDIIANPPHADANRITIFKSLGAAIEDLAAASMLYDRAVAARIGTVIGS
jgi:ornithine cyclodeaminase/alanine dehydrogenase-like protein (mu-crystallin family)